MSTIEEIAEIKQLLDQIELVKSENKALEDEISGASCTTVLTYGEHIISLDTRCNRLCVQVFPRTWTRRAGTLDNGGNQYSVHEYMPRHGTFVSGS